MRHHFYILNSLWNKEIKYFLLIIVPVRVDETSNSALQAYIHQHVWLMFTSLALNMATIIHKHDESGDDAVDADYMKSATQLHTRCVDLITGCLMKVSQIQQSGKVEVQ